jgi:hypothetical protein
MVQESLDVMVAYYLIHPKFGHDLQKITDEANRRLPLIWWHDLDADLRTAEEHFKKLNSLGSRGNMKDKSSVDEDKMEPSGIIGAFRSCIDFFHRLV